MPDEIVFVSTIHNSGKYIFHMFFKKLQHFRTVVVPPLDLDGQQVRVEGDFLSLLLRHQKARLQFFLSQLVYASQFESIGAYAS